MQEMQPRQRGLVHFGSSPSGASIYVDGQILVDPDTEESIKTPATVSLIEGRRNFTMTLEGHEDVSGYVDVFPGVRVDVHRNFKPGKSEGGWGEPEPQIWLQEKGDNAKMPPGVRALGIGTVNVTTTPPGAQIFIDGNPLLDEKGIIRKSPIILTNVPEGYHKFTYILEGYSKANVVADVVAGQVTDAVATLSPMK